MVCNQCKPRTVAQVKLSVIYDDDGHTECTAVMHHSVALKLLYDVMDWKLKWNGSVDSVEKYFEKERAFVEFLKNNKKERLRDEKRGF